MADLIIPGDDSNHPADVPAQRYPGRKPGATAIVVAVIVNALRASNNVKIACDHARIATATYHGWHRKGTTQLAELAAERGITPEDFTLDDISQPEHPYAYFVIAAAQARADFVLENLALIGKAGQGVESQVVRVVEKIDGDNVVERTTTTTSKVERDWRASAWLLERTVPDEYGRATRADAVDVGASMLPPGDQSPGARLWRALDEMATRAAHSAEAANEAAATIPSLGDHAIDVTSHEVPPEPVDPAV